MGGLEAGPVDHICGIFSSEAQRDQVLVPLLQAGLASGDTCICVMDGTSPGVVVAALWPAGQAAALTVGKQRDVYGASDLLLRSGGFSADEVVGARAEHGVHPQDQRTPPPVLLRAVRTRAFTPPG